MSIKQDIQIGKRLEDARVALGLSAIDVAQKMGLKNYQVLRNIEKGDRSIKVWEIAKLSQIYYKDAWFFLDPDRKTMDDLKIIWRKTDDTCDTSSIEARVKYLLENYILFEDLAGENSVNEIPFWPRGDRNLSYRELDKKAKEIITELNLGLRPALNLEKAMEEVLNIRVLHLKMEDYISAMTVYGEFGIAVIINANNAPWRKSFSLAHELFHIYSRKIYNLNKIHLSVGAGKSKMEKSADAFAAALLLPEENLKKELAVRVDNERIGYVDLIAIAREFRVSMQALLYRMENIHLIGNAKEIIESDDFISINRESRIGENLPSPEFSARFVRLGLSALVEGKISKGKFCRVFNIIRSQFSKFLAEHDFPEDIINGKDIQLSNP